MLILAFLGFALTCPTVYLLLGQVFRRWIQGLKRSLEMAKLPGILDPLGILSPKSIAALAVTMLVNTPNLIIGCSFTLMEGHALPPYIPLPGAITGTFITLVLALIDASDRHSPHGDPRIEVCRVSNGNQDAVLLNESGGNYSLFLVGVGERVDNHLPVAILVHSALADPALAWIDSRTLEISGTVEEVILKINADVTKERNKTVIRLK
ncbi:MAG TPA: hypothetical protein PKA27_16655 [Fimbriimonadaceae bacterium]|nr:hypothetical protein [Fimbriimonadaceae bacterium]